MRLRRSAKTLLATAASVLTLVSVPGTAHSESTSACYAAIASARTRAHLPAAGRQLALERAALNHARYRARWDAAGLQENPHYESSGHAGFSGRLPWDRTKAAGLRGGTWTAQGEDLTTGVNLRADQLRGVQSWIDAPYHRFPLLDANTRQVGCAQAQTGSHAAEVLEMVTPPGARARAITGYPGNGQTGVPTRFNRAGELPSPFRGARTAVVGYVVSVQASGYAQMKVSGMSLGRPHYPQPLYRAVRLAAVAGLRGAVDTELPANAAMMATTAPLAAHTRYSATVTGYVRTSASAPWQGFRLTWAFTTA
jgi:uncharacterized protein YkwD